MRVFASLSYKGRVLFRGDNERDGSGHHAVFSKQGHLAAARFRDVIWSMLESDSVDADAGACTQVVKTLTPKAEHAGEDTYAFIPRDEWPKPCNGKYT